ncbi:MAG: hypothetical protein KAT40_07315 [Bacteroidales bacterium]|nr:hypothetical protein [Bacteroidales bacterium]
MKTKNYLYILSIVLVGAILFQSCEKETSSLTDDEVAIAEDDALAESLFDDIFDVAIAAEQLIDGQIYGGTLKSSVVSDSCPNVTVDHPDSTYWPKVITIDYGDGCTGFYEQTRSGKIIIRVTGRYRVTGTSRTITLENYYINGIHVEGTKTVTNDGENDEGNICYSIELTGGKITTPDSIVITRESVRTREWVAGSDTWWNIWDDVYFITGQTTGTNFRGVGYSRTIIIPLEWAATCRFIKSGSIDIVVGENDPITLDFGDGECDNEATVSRNGETKTILLRYRHRNLN